MRRKGFWYIVIAIAIAVGSGIAAIPSGGSYSCAALEALWIEAAGSPLAAPTAAAIARAESRGVVTATNHNSDGTTDYGLWQINSVNGGSVASFVPLVNAEQAVQLYNKDGWSPWVSYQHGAQAGMC